MTDPAVPPIVASYFDAAARSDHECYFALFADDAVVEDEGNTYHGINEIRQWRPSTPLVSYEITSVEPKSDHSVVVTCTVSGDFPGSPVTGLRFWFEDFDDNAIRVLRVKL